MLAALSPARTNFNETMSTLRFAERAKTIVTQAITNDDPMQKLVRELQAEVERLKNKGGADGDARGVSDAELKAALREKEGIMEAQLEQQKRFWEAREANMKKLAAKQIKQASAPAGRRLKVLHRGERSTDVDTAMRNIERPYLALLTREDADGDARHVTTVVCLEVGKPLRVGRGGYGSTEKRKNQDLLVDGCGVAPANVVIWRSERHCEGNKTEPTPYISPSSILFFAAAASVEAVVYINGKPLSFNAAVSSPFDRFTGSKRSEQPGVVPVRNGDRIGLGHGACFLVAIAPASPPRSCHFDGCQREVILRREIIPGDRAYEERLAAFVLAHWRRPHYRARFERQLLVAAQAVVEANAILAELGLKFVQFQLFVGGTVNISRLNSLRLAE